MNENQNETKPRKRIVRKVSLRFFQDDSHGEWGATHADTLNNHNGNDGFNAFWDGQGIFHDVFEHAHENQNKYFRGDAAMNVGGEVAAMGALWFFYDRAGMWTRLRDGYHAPDKVTMDTTLYMMKEAIENGYSNFGDRLVCNVPKQKITNNSTLEWMIDEHYSQIKQTKVSDHPDEKDFARQYKNSVTFSKLARLYRYGYRMAQRLLGERPAVNGEVLNKFKSFWDEFCKNNNAETLAQMYRGIEFTIYRDTAKELSWKAVFIPEYGSGFERVTMRGDSEKTSRVHTIHY